MKRVLLWAFGLTVGCSGSDVYRVSSSPEGLPFYPLVPAQRETRVYEQRWERVRFTVKNSSGGFSIEFYTGPGACQAEATVGRLSTALAAGTDFREAIKDIGKCMTAPEPGTCTDDGAQPSTVPASQLIQKSTSYEMVPALEPLYVNVYVPHGGEATANLTFNEKGGLVSAEGTVKDTFPGQLTEALTGLAGTLVESAFGLGGAALGKTNLDPGEKPTATIEVTPQRRLYKWSKLNAPTRLGDKPTLPSTSCEVVLELTPTAPPPVEKATEETKPKDDGKPKDDEKGTKTGGAKTGGAKTGTK